MIPIKILCGCGQKYAFDAEPIERFSAHSIQCPVCGSDGTLMANEILAKHLAVAAASASGLRIEEQQRLAAVPLPRRMPNSAHRENVKVRNKWTVLSIAGTTVLLLVFAGVAISRGGHKGGPKATASLAELPVGTPRTLAELNAWYVEPPAGQNAAAVYLKGFDAMQLAGIDSVPFSSRAQLPVLGAGIPAGMRSALAGFVKSNQAALQLFAEGSKYDQCRYPVDLTRGFDALFPHSKHLGNATRLLELTAISHAEANQAELAANDVLVCLALANSLLEEPVVLGQLPRTWGIAYAVEALEQIANRTVLSAGALSELSKVFQRLEESEVRGEGFSRALAGEYVISRAALANPPQLLLALSAPDLKMPADRRSKITARLQKGEKLTKESEFLEIAFRRLIAARQAPFPDRLKSDDLGHELVAEALNKKLFVLDLLLPSAGRRTTIEAECLARLRLGSTAVALEQFRATHAQQYPTNLSELTPDYLSTPLSDPFDGEQLRYQKKGNGYLLYSIGPDLKDSSGERKHGQEGDIVFAVVTPATRRGR
jgi:hypothetical protein